MVSTAWGPIQHIFKKTTVINNRTIPISLEPENQISIHNGTISISLEP